MIKNINTEKERVAMFDYLNFEFQKAKEDLEAKRNNYEAKRNNYEAKRNNYEKIKMGINSIEKALNVHFLNPERQESFEKMSIVNATHKLLFIKGELTTKEIYNYIIQNVKSLKCKNSNSLAASLHNAAKSGRKGICHVGFSRWALKSEKE